VSSEATLEGAESALAASESNLARIQAMIELKSVEAPFAGTIGIPRIDVGQYVQPGTVIATLQQLQTMRVDFTIPEQRVNDLRMAQDARFGLSEQDFPYAGRIIGIEPKIDPQTRLISVRAEVANPRGELRPGQFVRVRVELPAVRDVIALPQTSLITSLYGDYVYLVEEGPRRREIPRAPRPVPRRRLRRRVAAPGAGGSRRAHAASTHCQAGLRPGRAAAGRSRRNRRGLQPGQTVVTSGQNKLANNAPVAINNAVDPAELALRGAAGLP
jgi:membrane fusion protein (multidrug efflux system)